jgi:hypothetical protein
VNLNTVLSLIGGCRENGLIAYGTARAPWLSHKPSREKPDERLRAQLRTALTQLILAGLKQPEIKALINEELDDC